MTTTTSRSKGRRASPSRRTSPLGSSPTAGTSFAWATPTTSIASSTLSASSGKRRGVPRSSSSTATSATARRTSTTRPRPTASRWVRRRSASPSAATGGRRRPTFLVPDGVREHFAAGIGARGAAARRRVDGALRVVPGQVPRARAPRSIRCNVESCRPAGTATFRSSPRMPRASPAETPRAKC